MINARARNRIDWDVWVVLSATYVIHSRSKTHTHTHTRQKTSCRVLYCLISTQRNSIRYVGSGAGHNTPTNNSSHTFHEYLPNWLFHSEWPASTCVFLIYDLIFAWRRDALVSHVSEDWYVTHEQTQTHKCIVWRKKNRRRVRPSNWKQLLNLFVHSFHLHGSMPFAFAWIFFFIHFGFVLFVVAYWPVFGSFSTDLHPIWDWDYSVRHAILYRENKPRIRRNGEFELNFLPSKSHREDWQRLGSIVAIT